MLADVFYFPFPLVFAAFYNVTNPIIYILVCPLEDQQIKCFSTVALKCHTSSYGEPTAA